MLAFILYALLAWFLYNLVFRFIIPIYKTTRDVKRKFREMHHRMQDETNKRQGFTPQNESPKPESKKPAGDYIDFEEIK